MSKYIYIFSITKTSHHVQNDVEDTIETKHISMMFLVSGRHYWLKNLKYNHWKLDNRKTLPMFKRK